MSRPMTPAETVAALRKFGVPFKEVAGWEHRNRDHIGPFADVRGFIVHHTGDDAPDTADLKVICQGRSDLPGPLAQFGCDDRGLVYLVGNGRANHAGGGDPTVLDVVTREDYDTRPPEPRFHTGSAGAADGNSHFYGVETFYSGGKPPTDAAYRSLVLLAAAICCHHGWSAKSVIGHKEWSDWKVDPGNVDMSAFRADVTNALRDGAGGVTTGGKPNRPLPEPLKNTRIRKARSQLQTVLDLLDKALAGGRGPGVEDARDMVSATLRKLPPR